MHLRAKHLVEKTAADPAYLRNRARLFRHSASHERDGVIHKELLRLAALYEEMAAEAEIALRASACDE